MYYYIDQEWQEKHNGEPEHGSSFLRHRPISNERRRPAMNFNVHKVKVSDCTLPRRM